MNVPARASLVALPALFALATWGFGGCVFKIGSSSDSGGPAGASGSGGAAGAAGAGGAAGATGGSGGGGSGGVAATKPGTHDSGIDLTKYPARGTVGPQGGSVVLPGGPTVTVPSGAFPATVGLALRPAATPPMLPNGSTAVSGWYDLASDTNDLAPLATSLTLSIPIKLPAGATATHPGLRVVATAGSGRLVPIEGTFDAATGTFRVALPGLPPKCTLAVVFTPSAVRMTTAEVPETPIPQGPAPTAPWASVDWTLVYDGLFVTKAQATKLLFYARRAARAYSTAGLREPSLVLDDDGTTKRWVVHLTGDGSYFSGGKLNVIGEAAFGRLYVDVARIDDPKSDSLGSVYASVAHELFHSIVAAYQLPYQCFNHTDDDGTTWCIRSSNGLNEGMATAVGYYLDQDAANPRPSEPYQPVSWPFGYFSPDAAALAYRNQDFYVYQLRELTLTPFAKQLTGLKSATLPAGADSMSVLSGYHVALDATADGWPEGFRVAFLQYVYQRAYAREKGPLWPQEPRAASAPKYSLDKGLFDADAVVKIESKHCQLLTDGATCAVDGKGRGMGAMRFDLDMKGGASLPAGFTPVEVKGSFKVTAAGASFGYFVVGQKSGIGAVDSVQVSPDGADVTLTGLNAKYDEAYVVVVPFGKSDVTVHLQVDVSSKTLSAACQATSKWMCTCQPGGTQPCFVWDLAVQQGCQSNASSGMTCDAWCDQLSAQYAMAAKDAQLWGAMGCTAGP
jgi:hypothetical protein